MDYREIPAPPALDQLIHCVWFLGGYGARYLPQPVVPDGRIELLVHLADPFSRMGRDGSSELQDSLLVAGQLTQPLHLTPGNRIDVVGIRLHPLGAHAILGTPLSELSNEVIPLRWVNRKVAGALHAAAASRGTHDQRAQAIMVALTRWVSTGLDLGMTAALNALTEVTTGNLASLTSHCGMSTRTLERRFLSHVGIPPKMYHRVVRFRQAFRMLGEAGQGGMARLAVRVGYYDQAHLIRDFRQFAGASPSTFFQSTPVLAQAFSTANHGATEDTKKNY